jgi:hypothetical protein
MSSIRSRRAGKKHHFRSRLGKPVAASSGAYLAENVQNATVSSFKWVIQNR